MQIARAGRLRFQGHGARKQKKKKAAQEEKLLTGSWKTLPTRKQQTMRMRCEAVGDAAENGAEADETGAT